MTEIETKFKEGQWVVHTTESEGSHCFVGGVVKKIFLCKDGLSYEVLTGQHQIRECKECEILSLEEFYERAIDEDSNNIATSFGFPYEIGQWLILKSSLESHYLIGGPLVRIDLSDELFGINSCMRGEIYYDMSNILSVEEFLESIDKEKQQKLEDGFEEF